MTYRARVHAQDATTGRVHEVLNGIDATADRAAGFTAVDVAVAYATRGGVGLLLERLQQHAGWSPAGKRWLVSIDFGITQPAALEALQLLDSSEVRIPNGRQVVASRRLMPRTTFHAKGYLFRRDKWSSPSGLIIGSANLSVSALTMGSEVMTSQSWSGPASSVDRRVLSQARPFLDWFEDAWAVADPLADVLSTYKARRLAAKVPRIPAEDRTQLAKSAVAAPSGKEVHGPLEIQLAHAKAIWFETGHLYENRGAGRAGNQLDTPRGTRVFFGFSANQVKRNTVLGHVRIRVPGFSAVERSVRFGDNQMDKVNLPVPGSAGPTSYDNAVLIFDREEPSAGTSQFRLTVTDDAGLRRRKRLAVNTVDLSMHGGRPYGLLF